MVLSLKLEKVDFSFSIFVVYAIILGLLCVLSTISYIKKHTAIFLNLVLMACCFLISDIFYVLNYFYLSLSALRATAVLTQVLSYYFMVRYFLERDKLTSIKQ
jgi:cytochrome c oxidase subunit IV